MPILREVITRFKFDTDERSVRQVERRVEGMKRGVRGLGKLLGIGLGVAGAKALFSLGQRAERAEFVLKNLAGTSFTALRRNMNRIRRDLDRVRAGAGAIFRERDFDIAAAGFIRVFGAGRRELQLFDQIFRSAAKQSAVTGENVVSLVQKLTGAIRSGDFSALLDFPGLDQAFVKRLEDINAILDPGELGGQAAIRQRMRALSEALSLVADRQNRSLSQVPGQLLAADRAGAKLQDTIENLAQTLNQKLVPVLDRLAGLLDKVSGGLSFLGLGNDEPEQESGLKGFARAARRRKEENIIRRLRSGQLAPEEATARPDLILRARERGPLPGGERSLIFQNTFHINGITDPAAVAAEIERIQKKTYNEARQNIVPTEDR